MMGMPAYSLFENAPIPKILEVILSSIFEVARNAFLKLFFQPCIAVEVVF